MPAVGLVGGGAVSIQFGAALATRLFPRVGPAGAATVRVGFAAVILAAGMGFARRPLRRAGAAGDLRVAACFGVVLAAMNLSFYEAIARIPLGVAVTVEFCGPLGLAVVASRRRRDVIWAAAAAAGVVLLTTHVGSRLDPAGIGLAVLAGAFWIAYILLSKETGKRFEHVDGLACAMAAGALALAPLGVLAAGSRLAEPSTLGIGFAVALLSSVVPYSLELAALRRISPRAFGVMTSLDPAVATAAGFAVLGQHLTPVEWAAIALVVAANTGNALGSEPPAVHRLELHATAGSHRLQTHLPADRAARSGTLGGSTR